MDLTNFTPKDLSWVLQYNRNRLATGGGRRLPTELLPSIAQYYRPSVRNDNSSLGEIAKIFSLMNIIQQHMGAGGFAESEVGDFLTKERVTSDDIYDPLPMFQALQSAIEERKAERLRETMRIIQMGR